MKNIEKNKKNKSLYQTFEPPEKDEDVWTKLKKIKYIPQDKKQVRVNQRKNIPAREYLSNTKDIQLMKYIYKNKMERFNMLSTIKKSELDSINSTLISLENSKDFIFLNYKEKYASYVSFLKRQKDEEEKNNLNLYLEKEKINHEISELQLKFNKIKTERLFYVNMVMLQIQLKEKMKNIPEKALVLFEHNINILDEKRRKNKRPKTIKNITNEAFDDEIKKVMKYKGKIIYNDISEFDYDYKQLENKVYSLFQQNEKLQNEIEQLKDLYIKEKEQKEFDPDAEDINLLNKELNKLKFKNKELNKDLHALKEKISNKKNYVQSNTRPILKHSLSTLSLASTNINLGNNTNNPNKTNKNNINYFFKTNIYYDTYTILSGFKSIFTLKNFNFSKMTNVSELFNYCYKVYNTSKDNLFNEIEINFEVEKNMITPKINEDLVIIKMLEYIDNVVSLLLIEKKNYFSENNSKKKYEKLKNLVEKDKRRMGFIKKLKEEEEMQKLKIKELELKKNKVYYIPTKKVEKNYYFKAQKENLLRLKKLEELRKPLTFEDFMYDIMV